MGEVLISNSTVAQKMWEYPINFQNTIHFLFSKQELVSLLSQYHVHDSQAENNRSPGEKD